MGPQGEISDKTNAATVRATNPNWDVTALYADFKTYAKSPTDLLGKLNASFNGAEISAMLSDFSLTDSEGKHLTTSKSEQDASKLKAADLADPLACPADGMPRVQNEHPYATPYDFSKLPESRYYGWGDDHISIANKRDFDQSMQNFRKIGGTHVGFEFFPRNEQNALNHYADLRQRQPRSVAEEYELQQLRHDFVGELDQRYQVAPCDNKRRMNEELMNMVDSAIDAGLKPIGIEPESFGQYGVHGGFDFMHRGLDALPQSAENALRDYVDPAVQERRDGNRQQIESGLRRNGWNDNDISLFIRQMDTLRDSNPPMALASAIQRGDLLIPPSRMGDRETFGWQTLVQDWRNENFVDAAHGALDQYDREHQQPGKMLFFAGIGHFASTTDISPNIMNMSDRLDLVLLPDLTERDRLGSVFAHRANSGPGGDMPFVPNQ